MGNIGRFQARALFILLAAGVLILTSAPVLPAATAREVAGGGGGLGDVRFFAYQIQNQEASGNIQKLADSHYDLLVIDQTRSVKGMGDYDSARDVSLLKNSKGSRGQPKKVICYWDVGEAESYRWYWKSGWKVGSPEWIVAPDPDGWDENYPVKFWRSAWKGLMRQNLDRIIADGYDGVYLDWLEVYSFEPVVEAAEAEGRDPEEELVTFVEGLAQYARQKKPGFIFIAQNAAELGANDNYTALFDALAQETVWFDGGGDPDSGVTEGDVPMPPEDTRYTLGNLELWQRRGKPVFNIEYAQEPSNVERAYSLGEEYRLTSYVTLRPLDTLTSTPPPGYHSDFYFPDGYTAPGFTEYLCICNFNPEAVVLAVDYFLSDGSKTSNRLELGPQSRVAINVENVVGAGHEVSARVHTDAPDVVAERSMYFLYKGRWDGGSSVRGAWSPAETWYFAEGNTLPGFEQWVLVMNAGSEPANLEFRYMVEGEGERRYFEHVGPGSRATFSTAAHTGTGKNTSLMLKCDKPVTAERAIYFEYQGGRRGGHSSLGITHPSREWLFSEGTTRGWCDEWLCVGNPNSEAITIEAEFMPGQGQGNVVKRDYPVGAKGRLTIKVNDVVGPEKDVAVSLSSEGFFVAERPMYFDYGGFARGGHCSFGVHQGKRNWLFAEGYTGNGFDEWITVQNPETNDTTVTATFLVEGATPFSKTYIAVAHSRLTIGLAGEVAPGRSVSVRLSSDDPVVCERSMYFIYSGQLAGGHSEPGYSF